MFLLDLLAIFCAALPLIIWGGLELSALFYSFEDVIDPFFTANLTFFGWCILLILGLFIASAVYNLIRTLNGRRTGYVGLVTNFLSFAIWFLSIMFA
jgi:hypothetical protein